MNRFDKLMNGLKVSWSLEPVPRNFLRLTRSLLPSWHEVSRWHCWAPFSATLETGKGHREDCQAKNNKKLKQVTSTKSGQARWSAYMYILLAVWCCQFVECEGNVSILEFQLTTLLRKSFGGFSTSALNWPQAMGWKMIKVKLFLWSKISKEAMSECKKMWA